MEAERDNRDEEQPDDDKRREDERLDEAIEETFPASDPIAPQDPER
ncbi:MAG TPA: hypothetical protein VFJ66_01220 [Gaiellales bacterium]|nr:hypothetical protein [Gaiellales bacterium]